MYVADWVSLGDVKGPTPFDAVEFTWSAEIDGTPTQKTEGAMLFRRQDGNTDRYEERVFAWYSLLRDSVEDGNYERFKRYYRAVSADWEDGENDYRVATESISNSVKNIDSENALESVPRVLALLAAQTSGLMYEKPPAVVVGAIITFHIQYSMNTNRQDSVTTVNGALPNNRTVDDVVEDMTDVLDEEEIEAVITPEEQTSV